MRRPGFQPPLVFGVLALLGLGVYLALYRASPGDLSSAHYKIGGSSLITDCRKCHAQEGLAAGCLHCHEEIRGQLDLKKGYHHLILENKKQECARCHSEHNGQKFQLINAVSWDDEKPEKFDHAHVDFRLNGKHDALSCKACHEREGLAAFSLPKFPSIKRKHSFLGLSQACTPCHKDDHAKGLSPGCENCHDQKKFRPTVRFDHDKSYPLKGGHSRISCKGCHLVPRNAKELVRFKKKLILRVKNFPFHRIRGKRCGDCHKSPHRARWGMRCESCHLARDSSWEKAGKRFKRKWHAKTGFGLAKPHQRVACRKCHKKGLAFNKKYPNPKSRGYQRVENRCEGCHRDRHGGQFMKKFPKCIRCHYAKGFLPTRYSSENHVSYPLEGAHIAVACNLCHSQNHRTRIRKYVGTPRRCSACHKDAHRGLFRRGGGTRCERCHKSVEAWEDVAFDHERQSRFKLGKAHEKLECRRCHPVVATAGGGREVHLKPINPKCEACHDFKSFK